MAPKLKRSQTDLKKTLQYGEFASAENPLDETALTDQELQDRLGAFQELGDTQGAIDPAGISRELVNQLSSFGVGNANKIADGIVGFISSQGRFPTAKELGGGGNTNVSVQDRAKYENFANDQATRNLFSGMISGQIAAPKVGGDVKRLQDMLGDRTRKASEQASLDSFVNEIPGQLSKNTEDFYAGKREEGKRTLQDFLNPQIRDQLGARGLLSSGDLDAELAYGAGEVLNPIEQQYAQSRADDLAFFENAAYQTNLKKTIDSNQNLASQIDFERGSALNAQSQRFQAGQNTIADASSMALFRRQQQSNLQAQQTRLQRQSDAQKAQSKSGMASGIGQSVGAIGGAVIGSMIAPGVGTAVGAGLGSQFGGGAANMISKAS